MYTGAHIQDVGNEEVEVDSNLPVAENVATSSSATPLNIMTVMASELVRIHKRIREIFKQISN